MSALASGAGLRVALGRGRLAGLGGAGRRCPSAVPITEMMQTPRDDRIPVCGQRLDELEKLVLWAKPFASPVGRGRSSEMTEPVVERALDGTRTAHESNNRDHAPKTSSKARESRTRESCGVSDLDEARTERTPKRRENEPGSQVACSSRADVHRRVSVNWVPIRKRRFLGKVDGGHGSALRPVWLRVGGGCGVLTGLGGGNAKSRKDEVLAGQHSPRCRRHPEDIEKAVRRPKLRATVPVEVLHEARAAARSGVGCLRQI